MIYRSSFRKNKSYFHLAAQLTLKNMSSQQKEFSWKELSLRIRRHTFLTPHCCVLMSNHFHGIFEVSDLCYEMAEAALKAEFGQLQDYHVRSSSEETFKIIKIDCIAAYRETYRYIYRNPIEAGLCHRAEVYPFSTLGELIGYRAPTLFVADALGVIANPFKILDWINNSENPRIVSSSQARFETPRSERISEARIIVF